MPRGRSRQGRRRRAERHIASTGAERAAVGDVDEQQPIFDDRQAVDRLDARLHPGAQVGGDADALPRPSTARMTTFGSPLLSTATLIANSSASLSS